jgi:crossover junction endodeoxyribonuclease RusA
MASRHPAGFPWVELTRKPLGRDRPDDRRTPDFEFCVHGRPVSAQTDIRSRLAAWQRQIRAAATAAWPAGQPPYAVAVELRITHYAERPIADMDNLIKPIQDALQGITFVNDRAVKDVAGNWRDIDGRFRLRYISRPLADAFSDGRQFVHIRLWLAPDEEDLG